MGNFLRGRSAEHVFIYDISGRVPVRRGALPVPTAFNGIAWRADGSGFFVSGGFTDTIRVYKMGQQSLRFRRAPIGLGHKAGVGIEVKPMTAGLAVSPRGDRLLAANFMNDSVSLVDIATRKVMAEQDLRPGKIDAGAAGVAGGEYPFAVAWASDTKAYVGSQRDREIATLTVATAGLAVRKRIKLAGQPTKMILNKDRSRLFIAVDNSDTVVVLEAKDGDVLAEQTGRRSGLHFCQSCGVARRQPEQSRALARRAYAVRDRWRPQRRRGDAAGARRPQGR